jgi:hypothetical protein
MPSRYIQRLIDILEYQNITQSKEEEGGGEVDETWEKIHLVERISCMRQRK